MDARNVQRSLGNALAYFEISGAMGIDDREATPDERWARLSRLWSDDPADADHRRGILEMMAAQSQEFHEHDVEYGYLHRSAAVVDDGSPDTPERGFRMFFPSTRPGSPLPHAWVEDDRFARRSTLDLVAVDRFLLIAGESGQPWRDAALKAAAALGVELDAYCIGHSSGDLRDPRLRWERVREIGPEGAVLVRPDRCVAFRSLGPSADPEAEVRVALAEILSRVP